jgi:hypothetical protein
LERERRDHGEFFPSLDPDCDADGDEIHAPFNPNPSSCSSWTMREMCLKRQILLSFFSNFKNHDKVKVIFF